MRARVAALALAVAACRAGEDYVRPELAAPEGFAGAAAGPALDAADMRWWSKLGDAQLDALIERALAHNLDLELAAARVREARAIVEIEGGAARPTVDGSADVARRESSTSVASGQYLPPDDVGYHQLGFDARWEFDLFGRVARGVEAAQAQLEATIEDGRAVMLRLLAEVAHDYVSLRAVELELELVRAGLAAQLDTAELVRSRAVAGLDDELELARAEGLAATTRARLPALERERASRLHALATLVGAWPSEFEREPLGAAPIPTPPDALAAGLPLDLLRRRPDVRRAERELARAAALSAAATAELYPRISLAAAFGWQSEDLGDLLSAPSQAWSFGPSLTAPLFRGGVLQAAIRARGAQQDQALLRYEQSFRDALREVEDALTALARSRERFTALETASAAQRRAVELARDRYRSGLADFLGVLDAERSALEAEAEVARGRAQVASAAIALYKALGGGWEGLELPERRAPDAPTAAAAWRG